MSIIPPFPSKLAVMVFCIMYTITSSGQHSSNATPLDDSKLRELKNYTKWTINYASQKEYDSANKYSDRALRLANELKNQDLIGYAKTSKALSSYWQVNTPMAKQLLSEVLETPAIHDSIAIESQLILSDVYTYEQDYVRAISHVIAAEKVIRMHPVFNKRDSLQLGRVYLSMGELYKLLKEFKKSYTYYDKAIAYNIDYGNKSFLMYLKSGTYEDEMKIKEAITLVKEAVSITTEKNRHLFLPTYHLALSKNYLKLAVTDSAVYHGRQGLIDNDDCQVDLLYGAVGDAYYQSKDFDNALFNYKSSLESAHTENYALTAHENLRNTYSALGKYKEAISHNEAYLVLRDSLDDEKIKQEIIAITEKYESSKKQLEIEQLNSQNSENELVIQAQRSKLWIAGTILGSLLLLLGGVYYFYLQQKRQRHLLFIKNSELAKELATKRTTPTAKVKEETQSIDDKKRIVIHNAISQLIKEEFYLDTQITLANMAKRIDTNTTYLSKIINEDYEKTFAHFINELRLSHTLKSLESNPNYRNLTIDHIAEKSGFASPSTFYNAFKKYTGLTPSYYIKKRLSQSA